MLSKLRCDVITGDVFLKIMKNSTVYKPLENEVPQKNGLVLIGHIKSRKVMFDSKLESNDLKLYDENYIAVGSINQPGLKMLGIE
jgi:hypothetical protein